MKTKIVKIDKDNFKKEELSQAAHILKEGGLVAFPTETVYGLGANGLDERAVRDIYRAKGRPSDNPLILHIGEVEQLDSLVEEIPEIAYKCIEEFWPGPLTMIFKRSPKIPDIITAGLDTVAIRMPEDPIARELINLADLPIAAPSANLSGKPSPTNGAHVIQDMSGKIPMIIDGGDTGIGLESTVLDLSSEIPIILRPGGVSFEELKRLIPVLVEDEANLESGTVPKSPGQKYRHYAPKAEMIVFQGDIKDIVESIEENIKKYKLEGKKIGVMATDETRDKYSEVLVKTLGTRANKKSIGSKLFKTLREFDDLGVDVILAEGVELDHIGKAIMNRMMKASGGNIIDC